MATKTVNPNCGCQTNMKGCQIHTETNRILKYHLRTRVNASLSYSPSPSTVHGLAAGSRSSTESLFSPPTSLWTFPHQGATCVTVTLCLSLQLGAWLTDSPDSLPSARAIKAITHITNLFFFKREGSTKCRTNAAIIWHIYKHWLSLLGEPGTVEPPKTEIISWNLSFICDYMNKWINTTFRDISKKQSHPSLKRDIRNNRGDWTLWRIVSIEISMLLFAA